MPLRASVRASALAGTAVCSRAGGVVRLHGTPPQAAARTCLPASPPHHPGGVHGGVFGKGGAVQGVHGCWAGWVGRGGAGWGWDGAGRRGMAGHSSRDLPHTITHFHVVIVGRPNVGKSSLLNRLAGRKVALVHDQPGVTRDRIEAAVEYGGMHIKVTDTAGLDDGIDMQDSDNEMQRKGPHLGASGIGRWPSHLLGKALEQTTQAVRDSSLALMVVDGRAGVTPLDIQFSRWLQRLGRPTILVVNKSESGVPELPLEDIRKMGLGEPVYISAAHNEGMAELASMMRPVSWSRKANEGLSRVESLSMLSAEGELLKTERMLRVCIMGKPNVGKSTLVNTLLEREGERDGTTLPRLLVGPEPGVTRDPVPVTITHRGREMMLVDTAGLRRKSKVLVNGDQVDIMTTMASLDEVKWSQVCALLLDATEPNPLSHQDMTIVSAIAEQGKGVVIVLSKIDQLTPKQRAKWLKNKEDLLQQLSYLGDVPFVQVSAHEKQGLDELLDACWDTHECWRSRISTRELMTWLVDIKRVGQAVSRRHPVMKFARQVDAGPPTIVLLCDKAHRSSKGFETFLMKSLRSRFNLHGVPIKLVVRESS